MQHLLPINDNFKGCELIFPETVFYNHGKPVMFVQSDKEWCLTAIKNHHKKGADKKNRIFDLKSLASQLTAIFQERKKETQSVFSQIYMK